jgi:hypothetical protein
MLTDLCIYTIKHSDDLRATLNAGGHDTYKEGKKWARAKRLLKDAKRVGKRLPVVFAPAEATRHLFAWALLDDVNASEESTYTFSELQLFDPRPLKTTLKRHRTASHLIAGLFVPMQSAGLQDICSSWQRAGAAIQVADDRRPNLGSPQVKPKRVSPVRARGNKYAKDDHRSPN